MLPKSLRLPRKDFLIAKSQGQTHKFPQFSIVVHPRSTPNEARRAKWGRFSVVTSSKLHKHAVVRNRLRRLIYSQLRNCATVQLADFIIYPRPSMLNLTREEISRQLNQALSGLAPVRP